MNTSYVVRRRVENEYLVRVRDRRWRRELGLVVLAVLPVALGLLLNIWAQLRVLQASYDIDALEQQLSELEDRRQQLEVTEASLSRPDRVRGLALELGMTLPREGDLVTAESLYAARSDSSPPGARREGGAPR